MGPEHNEQSGQQRQVERQAAGVEETVILHVPASEPNLSEWGKMDLFRLKTLNGVKCENVGTKWGKTREFPLN